MLDFIHDVDEFIDEENNIHMVCTTSSIQYANNSKFREKKIEYQNLAYYSWCVDYWW